MRSWFLFAAGAVALAAACSSAGGTEPSGGGSPGGSSSSEGGGGQGGGPGAGGGNPEGGSSPEGGAGGGVNLGGQGGKAGSGVITGACKSACGPEELCDPAHLGYDDDCDGEVDETCSCMPGQSHWCFRGDPALRFEGACQDGTEQCTELGGWSSCIGGQHALEGANNCLQITEECQDLKVAPFTKVKLANGTVGFAKDADPGSDSYKVTCPAGVNNCPAVNSPMSSLATFQPLQSGEYGVTYTKTVNGVGKSCNYSLYVGTGGLRVELSWDNLGVEAVQAGGAKGPDLDLHLHRPGTTTPWGFEGGSTDDCYYGNCRIEHFSGNEPPAGNLPLSWFSDAPGGPDAHNWTFKSDSTQNSCYGAPKGVGGQWKALGKGCHNPRLDIDTFSCDATITDPSDPAFCAPENINLDEVPSKTWFRVGVHYNAVCSKQDTHPVITVYCEGGQVARLGSVMENGQLKAAGYATPITLKPSDCGDKFWVAADIYVEKTDCTLQCTVVPVFSNAGSKAPVFLTTAGAKSNFGPPYPSMP